MNCFVVYHRGLVKRLRAVMGEDWFICCVGDNIMGRKFQTIILSQGLYEKAGYYEWVRDLRGHADYGCPVIEL